MVQAAKVWGGTKGDLRGGLFSGMFRNEEKTTKL